MKSLNEKSLQIAVSQLCDSDARLASVVTQFGPPPLWARKPGFATLVHIILEQQVSLASAKACFDKLNLKLTNLNPINFLALGDEELLRIGFSRQKTRYTRILARAIIEDSLDLAALGDQTDNEVFSRLTALTGIGPWTANIYLLMALGRPDIWPEGDLALLIALKSLFELDQRPTAGEFQVFGEKWRPHRAVAARILWHYYLSK